jgi:hypothetical protein
VLNKEWQTLVKVDVPLGFSANHLFFRCYRIDRADLCAQLATGAKIVGTKFIARIGE